MKTKLLNNLIYLLQKQGNIKESNFLDNLFPQQQFEIITECPICKDTPEVDCVLCDGSREIISIVEDDEEDIRISNILNPPKF